jgi:soluble lytic murein transglycosylase-like protein
MSLNATISVPKPNLQSPSSWGSRNAVKGQVENIMKKYGSFIKTASENARIPAQVIASFIAVESGGNPTAGGSGSVTQGLMQWNRTYAQNILETEYRMGRLTPEEKSILAKYGITFNAQGKTRAITQADQIKPELNIIIGTILLGQYADSYHDGGKSTMVNSVARKWAKDDSTNEIRLDRMIAVYNAGAYGDAGKKARTGAYSTAKALADNVNSITSSYIKKMLGKDGAMDVATTDLKSLF